MTSNPPAAIAGFRSGLMPREVTPRISSGESQYIPTRPAAALLKIVATSPDVALKSLHK
jgi:hypothetical protein